MKSRLLTTLGVITFVPSMGTGFAVPIEGMINLG